MSLPSMAATSSNIPGLKLAEPPPPPEYDNDEVAAFVTTRYTRSKNARQKIEYRWYTNMAMYDGRQYLTPVRNPQAGVPFKFTTPPAPPWRVRAVFNRIRPVCRREMSRLTSQKPTAYVIPASSEDKDTMAAQAAEQIWESLYRDLGIQKIVRNAVYWTVLTGTGYIKMWWDPDGIDDVTGQKGVICAQAEDPFHIYIPNLRATDIEDQPWVIHASVMNVEEAKFKYADALGERELNANCTSEDDILNSAWLDLSGTTNTDNDSVLILEMWIKPGQDRKFPNGGMITLVGSQVVQYIDSWPYVSTRFPFAKIDHVPNGQFYARSVIDDLVSVQKEYNRTRSQIIEAKNRMAKPQLMAAKGSVDASKITTEPGQLIEYIPGFAPPQPLPLQALPSYVLQELDRLNMDFDDISGQHEVSRGQVPPGVTAATAISYLQEQDDSKLSWTTNSVEEAVEKLAFNALNHVQQFWVTPRVIKVAGSSNSFNALLFRGADIRGNTDIHVEAGSALPQSKAARQAFIMDLMKMGYIPPDTGLKVLEVGATFDIYEDLEMDDRQVQRENVRMSESDPRLMDEYNAVSGMYDQMADPETGMVVDPNTGQPLDPPQLPVPVNTWDDHGKHIDLHNRYRKSQGFEALPQQTKDLFEAHVRSHVAALLQSTMPGGDPSALMNSSVPPEVASQNDGQFVSNDGGASSNGNDTIPTNGPPPQDMGAPPNG